jgi:hypothetical protein
VLSDFTILLFFRELGCTDCGLLSVYDIPRNDDKLKDTKRVGSRTELWDIDYNVQVYNLRNHYKVLKIIYELKIEICLRWVFFSHHCFVMLLFVQSVGVIFFNMFGYFFPFSNAYARYISIEYQNIC